MIKKIGLEGLGDVVELALLLWPHHFKEELDQEFTDILSDQNSAGFIEANRIICFTKKIK
jgi:hypothetical protein